MPSTDIAYTLDYKTVVTEYVRVTQTLITSSSAAAVGMRKELDCGVGGGEIGGSGGRHLSVACSQ